MATSIPFVSPLYPDPPVEYSDARLAVAILEGPAPVGIVPQQAQPAAMPLRLALFADYPESTIGPYREMAVLAAVTWHGEPALFCSLIYVTTDVALCQGREVWGFPKKLARIDLELESSGDVWARLERAGELLIDLEGSAPEDTDPAAVADLAALPILNRKWIPGPAGKEPDVDALTLVAPHYSLQQVWMGTGNLHAAGEAADVLGSTSAVALARLDGDMTLPGGETVA